MIVTTSWDDGDILDGRVASLLDRYRIRGTFYLSREYRRLRVPDATIRDIAARHEIGAHTLSHPDLTTLSSEERRAEIEGGKRWLEQVADTCKKVLLSQYWPRPEAVLALLLS